MKFTINYIHKVTIKVCLLFFGLMLMGCSGNDVELSQAQKEELVSFLNQSEQWYNTLKDEDEVSLGFFEAHTFSPNNSQSPTPEATIAINNLVSLLGVANDVAVHDWVIEYGSLLREIKVENQVASEDKYFRELVETYLPEANIVSVENMMCVVDAHVVLQEQALNKANSYSVSVVSENGELFDLENFMTLRGLGSGLHRIHQFALNRKACH